ncbi:DHA2 family efflux MFS transporter permease subunit [Variovorax sp. J22P271]|uniref:DHA2 family efflux MFS transporter permease subunit n=1 Tax=Variovorax davisae TaxID=3053515 RepID=UPI002574B61A|nr:DHA2 family efflux MFS transporter permease subunit [Variovorax sp. J22P271]MDM0033800.1 DHA2 family efflux MFS transporter permease subunit [Variovorax sp. J22P271]
MTIATAPTATAPAAAAHPPQASPWPVFWVASVAAFLVSLDSTMLYAAFGALRTGFPDASAAEMSWVLNAYTVVYAAMLIPAGGLSDAHGRKRVFMLGVTLFIAASAACGLAGSVGWLIAARVLQAVGAALLTPASLSIVLAAFPQSKRAVTVSLWGAVGGFAAAVGPSLGSFVIQTIGWPWAFFINLPIGALSLWFGASLLTESARSTQRARIDGVGMALLIVAVGALTLAIVESESPAWSRGQLAVVAATGAIALVSFVLWARKVRAPLIDLALFRHPTYSAVNAATLTFGIAFAMMFFAFFFYMNNVWHYSQALAGLAIAPGPLMVIPVAVVTGRLAGRYGHRPFLVGGALLFAATGLWFLLVPGTEPAYATRWLPGLILSGASVGLVMPSLSGAAVSKLPAAHYAVGSAVNQATRQIGSVIGVAITVVLLGHGALQRGDFDAVYQWHIALALLTALLCTLVNTRPAAAARS